MSLEARIWVSRLGFGPWGGTEKKEKEEKKKEKEEEKFPLCVKA